MITHSEISKIPFQIIGKTFPSEASLKEYGLTEKELSDYYEIENCRKDYNAYLRKKRDDLAEKFHLPILLVLLCFLSFWFHYYLDIHIIGGMILAFLATPLVSCIAFYFSVPLMDIIFNSLILKALFPFKDKHPKTGNIERYLAKKKEISVIQSSLKQRFNVSNSNAFDLTKIFATAQQITCSKLSHFVELLNKEIDENNQKLEQRWWYDLDPFTFEEEVAKWFEKKDIALKSLRKQETKELI